MPQLEPATRDDVSDIYNLLSSVRYEGLPSFVEAKDVITRACSVIMRNGEEIGIWVAFHGSDETFMDVVISKSLPKNIITKGMCKYVLAYGFSLGHSNRIVVDCYNPKGVKAALKAGFKMTEEDSNREGWVRLVLTKEEFQRKYGVNG